MDLYRLRIITALSVTLAACILIILERFFPYTPNQKFFREGFFVDFFFYTFFQSFILGLVISLIIGFTDSRFNSPAIKIMSNSSLSTQLAFFLVTHDIYIYWFHKWQHNSKFLWRIHEVHHSAKQVDWLSGIRSHSFEILINQTIEFLPLVLLGASPALPILKGSIDSVWGMYIHSNINVKSGFLQLFINGPEMHRWHHADKNISAFNKNFSTKFAVWDWIFNTAYKPKFDKPGCYGLSEINFPENYFSQQLFVFRKINRSKNVH